MKETGCSAKSSEISYADCPLASWRSVVKRPDGLALARRLGARRLRRRGAGPASRGPRWCWCTHPPSVPSSYLDAWPRAAKPRQAACSSRRAARGRARASANLAARKLPPCSRDAGRRRAERTKALTVVASRRVRGEIGETEPELLVRQYENENRPSRFPVLNLVA
ncbi:hypothetical protein GQ53DRAFT_326709 [Thozetella sp. PMI_491]|nr:hypothetical protein GQ53DRAFT_326709 [Thozetella sp. PMI_491]